ncbi:MAG: hypothetical protein WAP37_00135 [Solirubrobacterales bacterium]
MRGLDPRTSALLMTNGNQDRKATAREAIEFAWTTLPSSLSSLLENIGADQWRVYGEPLGPRISALLRSSGEPPLSPEAELDFDSALGAWIPRLRVVAINALHPSLAGLDEASYVQMIMRTAWHEWGHALSLDRATDDDVRRGPELLRLAPAGISSLVRQGGYRRGQYTHELVANAFSVLMARRLMGGSGRPGWMRVEIYEMIERVLGWKM